MYQDKQIFYFSGYDRYSSYYGSRMSDVLILLFVPD